MLLSSHLMSEMALTAERLLIIGRGKLLADTTVDELVNQIPTSQIIVATTDRASTDVLAQSIQRAGGQVAHELTDQLRVTGIDVTTIGWIARSRNLALTELTPVRASLEDAYLNISHGTGEHTTSDIPAPDLEEATV